MTDPVVFEAADARPVHVVNAAGFEAWAAQQPAAWRRWLESTGFKAKPQAATLLPGEDGAAVAVLVVGAPAEAWDAGALQAALPAGAWRLEDPEGLLPAEEAAYGFALAGYRFERYRRDERPQPQLVVDRRPGTERALCLAGAVATARDLVNTPANDMGPAELQEAAERIAASGGARCTTIPGDDLLAQNYPTIHAVGRASDRAPRLIEILWGEADAPRLTLVGKGVCFDTGGLDIKPPAGMLLMKKDMGGAALMLGLAQAIMARRLPVRLRVLIPAVENSIAGAAFRPGDVLRTRKGLTVEVGNTDAEGRLILCDALADADAEEPALLLDAATLTGAARVAVGPDVPALFSDDDELAAAILEAGKACAEPLWRLPMHAPYKRYLKSGVADLNNVGSKPFAGATTAALFLKEFVSATRSWAHLDISAWNDEAQPGRPRGGEASGLRPLFTMIERRFGGA
ncbi:leucyl aminopeptidase family protein [Marinimicrococcus flavescens]|uniref:Leucyl aminopeptidase family protein n=1 Tax=Marinimicrococcus flavescens TaxID=3031815 RepID=A0AAP3XRZ5_9PROT|nr:leucyl aminopeptidase family protein [Marinimicrococcus flavescens]